MASESHGDREGPQNEAARKALPDVLSLRYLDAGVINDSSEDKVLADVAWGTRPSNSQKRLVGRLGEPG